MYVTYVGLKAQNIVRIKKFQTCVISWKLVQGLINSAPKTESTYECTHKHGGRERLCNGMSVKYVSLLAKSSR